LGRFFFWSGVEPPIKIYKPKEPVFLMKKWAKILLVFGIIWLIAVIAYPIFFCPATATTPVCHTEIIDMTSGGCPNYDLNRNLCLEQGVFIFIFGVLMLGLPSWIMFIVVAIWGRK
jgi:hypothetical protein